MQTEWGEMGGEGASSFWELVLGLLLFAILFWGAVALLIEKQAEDPSPFRGGDECRTLFSHPIAIYPLGYI